MSDAAIETTRLLLEQLKEAARNEQDRRQFSILMASAQNTITLLDRLETGNFNPPNADLFAQLYEITFNGVVTSTAVIPEDQTVYADEESLTPPSTIPVDVSDIVPPLPDDLPTEP